ncbi:GNAT family N-acetyltransferase [Streptomyces sp. NBC_00102]|uniref:GNAT family N-acetyltransferase n=1 Tax=Streptomyces sp. NBC_00102 TaxID=2975652 RepID=UPI00225171BE|nr:GNAT family N-acetyltransferase [Streptomyces sp. NBC_00102]MCX5396933.1 GNAT family N-acetyltransferase [Streptomyces sp. NBC_00102]
MTVEIRHYTADRLPEIRQDLLDIHVEVRHNDFGLTGPFYEVARFDERLSSYASRPGWAATVGYEDGQPVGFAFGVPLGPDTRWWSAMTTPLPDGYTEENGTRTVALNEIVVRKPWRGRGIAWQIHEAWLAQRKEERVTLLVNPTAGNGAVLARYEAWGYRKVGDQQPFSDSPVFASMTRPVRQR